LVEKYQLKKISNINLIDEIIKLTNYPEVLNEPNLSSAMVLVVSSLVGYQAFNDHDHLIRRLMTYTQQTDVLYSSQIDRNYVLALYRIAKYHGVHHEYLKVIELCDLGIQYSMDRMSMYMFDYFYYFKSLAYYELKDLRNYEEMLFKCYGIIHSTGTVAKVKKFQDMIEQDFNIKLDEFVIEYIKQKQLGQ